MIAPTRRITAGTFVQGDDGAYPEESPSRTVHVAAFEIDLHPVTNAQFAEFVDSTAHVTTAERDGAAVFVPAAEPVDLARPELWWRHEPLANWRRPSGTTPFDVDDHADHPVVAVTHADATVYAAWCGGRLPTESEWEWAAGGDEPLPATWPLADDGRLLANVWLGEFPWRSIRNRAPGTMPVGAFAPNRNGLYDTIGNVWELTADPWSLPTRTSTCCAPPTTSTAAGVVAKGGSFLCAANYCRRYRPAARHRQAADEAACHIGFRCAYDLGTTSADADANG